MTIDFSQLITEGRNPASQNIDELSTDAVLRVINNEDKKVALAVEAIVPQIAHTVDAIVAAFAQGYRLIDLQRRRHLRPTRHTRPPANAYPPSARRAAR